MQLRSRLIETRVPERAEGAVLVLHGGGSGKGRAAVSPTQLSVLRMVPIARRIARAGRGRLAVFRLLNTVRGWDTSHTPADDARWALHRIAERLGGAVPTCLVGHSLGGRAALRAAVRPEVRGAVALAPWFGEDERPPPGLEGRRVLIVQGTDDRVARPDRTEAMVRALGRTVDVGYVRIAGGTHAMLRHHARFDGLAADFAATTLLEAPASGALARLAAGERWVEA